MNMADFEFESAAGSWNIEGEVRDAVAVWLRWLAQWDINQVRTRKTVCKRCTGSPLLLAAGITDSVPHHVVHALVMRIHKIIDKRVDLEVAARLPLLHAELTGAAEWGAAAGFDPRAGLDPEFDGDVVDPEPHAADAPFLFTLEELAAAPVAAQPVLPLPPLTPAEKNQLREELRISDEIAAAVGHAACFALQQHRGEIVAALDKYVEPQIAEMLAQLAQQLDYPDFR